MASDIQSNDLQFQQEQRNALVRAYGLTREAMFKEYSDVMSAEPRPVGFTWSIDGRPQRPGDDKLKALEDALRQELAEFDRQATSR